MNRYYLLLLQLVGLQYHLLLTQLWHLLFLLLEVSQEVVVHHPWPLRRQHRLWLLAVTSKHVKADVPAP